jgi:SAM-dependent methyltransferase
MEAGGDQSAFWNQVARSRRFTHPLEQLFAVLTCIPCDDAQRNLLREFKRILRPGGLLLISDYPLQTDARNLERYGKFAHEPGGYGTFRLRDRALLRRRLSSMCSR